MKNIFLFFILIVSSAALSFTEKKVHIENPYEHTHLIAYLLKPDFENAKYPAIVLLHGRRGLYSTLANGIYEYSTFSKRHKMWANFWTERGYVVLFVDSFGSRGYPEGFDRGTHANRPEEVNEKTVRPLDAYSGLKYLRTLSYVQKNKIGVMGWSNGGSTVLNTLAQNNVGLIPENFHKGFQAGLALYPGCGSEAIYDSTKEWSPYAPLYVLLAGNDEEVSPKKCLKLLKNAYDKVDNENKTDFIRWHEFMDATHNYDDPSLKHRDLGSNEFSTHETFFIAEKFFAKHLQNH